MRLLRLLQKKQLLSLTLLAGAALTLAAYLTDYDWKIYLSALLALIFVALLARKFAWGFVALLALRPVLDLAEGNLFYLGPLSLNPAGLAGLLLVAVSTLFLLANHQILKNLPVKLPVALLLGLAGFSILYSPSPSDSIAELIKLLNIFLIFSAAFVIAIKDRSTDKYLTAILAGTGLPCLLGLWQLISSSGGFSGDGLTNRLTGSFIHPNLFAFFLVITANLVIYFLIGARDKFVRLAWLGALGLNFLLILFTYTRGAWLGLTISGLVWGMLFFSKRLLAWLAGWLVLLTLATLLVWPLAEQNFDLVGSQLYQRLTAGSLVKDASLQSRLEVWQRARQAFLKKPMTGYGLGTFILVESGQINSSATPLLEAHNDYFRLAVELGIFGALLYIFIWLAFARISVRALKSGLGKKRPAGALVLALALTFLVVSFFDNILRFTAVLWLLWTTLGFIGPQLLVAKTTDKPI